MQEQTPIIPQTPPQAPYSPQAPQPPEPVPPLHPEPPEPSRWQSMKGALSTLLILIAAPLIALFLTAFVFQSYEVDGPSMETTLQHGDRLVVLKSGKTWASLTNRDFIPDRGEVIVFSFNEAGNVSGGQQLIKRVIGLPGERVVVSGGQITVYNEEFPRGFNPDLDEKFRNQVDAVTPGDVDLIVPEGQVFVCGDNRDNSYDSRSFGPIPSESIDGTLAMRIYPFSKFKSF